MKTIFGESFGALDPHNLQKANNRVLDDTPTMLVIAHPCLRRMSRRGPSSHSPAASHRQSEDLDLAWPDQRLPRPRIDALIRKLAQEGWTISRNDSPEAYNEFLIAGMELHDYQQDLVASAGAGSVKLSFGRRRSRSPQGEPAGRGGRIKASSRWRRHRCGFGPGKWSHHQTSGGTGARR